METVMISNGFHWKVLESPIVGIGQSKKEKEIPIPLEFQTANAVPATAGPTLAYCAAAYGWGG